MVSTFIVNVRISFMNSKYVNCYHYLSIQKCPSEPIISNSPIIIRKIPHIHFLFWQDYVSFIRSNIYVWTPLLKKKSLNTKKEEVIILFIYSLHFCPF